MTDTDRITQLEASCAAMREAMTNVLNDPHDWSDRPCRTCLEASKVIGHLVGCYEYQRKCGRMENIFFDPQPGKSLLDRLQAVEKDRDRYKEVLKPTIDLIRQHVNYWGVDWIGLQQSFAKQLANLEALQKESK